MLLAALVPLGCDKGGGADAADADAVREFDEATPEPAREAEGPEADAEAEEAYPYPPAHDALIPLDGQVLFPVFLDGGTEPSHLVVDTGAGRSAFEESLLREVKNGVGQVTIDFGGGILFPDYKVLAVDLSAAENHIGVPIHGLIGQELFATLYFSLDYRASRAHVSTEVPPVPPPGFESGDAIEVPYTVVQTLPLVTVRVGDTEVTLIADTGSGVTLVTESSVPSAILQTGIDGYVWYTSYGSDPAKLVRLPSLTIAGHEVTDSWAAVVPDDFHLKAVFDGLGVSAVGFVGYPVYRRFHVAIIAAEERYQFYPYPDISHLPAFEWDRVGLEVMREQGAVTVDMVFAPSDAADQGIATGDVLTAIDGQSLDGMPLDEIRLMLRGAPGETRTLDLERGAAPLQLEVEVDRLLEPLE